MIDEFNIPPLVQKILSDGISLSLLAAFCLFIEAIVNMRPRDAALLRSIPILIGIGVSFTAFQYSSYLYCILFGICGITAAMARLMIRDYWNPMKRFAVNCLPLASYLIAAGILSLVGSNEYLIR